MKKNADYDKLRGGYYTPQIIADFLAKWAVHSSKDSILEPSCGDGSFIRSVQNQIGSVKSVTGVELDSAEAEKAAFLGAKIVNDDFFSYYQKEIQGKHKFDVVVGNPPFIRSQNFDEKYRKIAFSLMEQVGLHPNRLTNIWIPFLVLSTCALKKNGRLGMVIPAELLQVDYAAEVRKYLSDVFESLTIISFKKLLFSSAQQEVVLILGEMTSAQKGIRIIEVENADSLQTLDVCSSVYEVKEVDHDTEKWTQYYLSNDEIALLRRLRADSRISRSEELFDVNVGIVSGENDFFLIDEKTREQYELEECTIPIVGRAEQLQGVAFSTVDLQKQVEAGKKMFLFTPEDREYCDLSQAARKYIDYGVSRGYHKGYKCRIRKHWYVVPRTWKADAFMLRQVNRYARIVYNGTEAQNTDTLHKIRFLPGVNAESVSAAFLNSYTLALCEVMGRSYGGGVLTFEPGEVRKLSIPVRGAERINCRLVDKYIRENRIDDILDYNDRILLEDGLGLPHSDVLMLREVWDRLSSRRIGRKKGATMFVG